jgi:DNA-binding response OmpR family regulator
MPLLSGLELVTRIRESAAANYVYVLMLTSRTDKSDIVSGIEAGADDFVSKPFDREELRVRLLAGEGSSASSGPSAGNAGCAGDRMREDRSAAEFSAMLPRTAIGGRVARLDLRPHR